MALLNKLFDKKKPASPKVAVEEKEVKETKESKKIDSKILLSPVIAEKAMAAQQLNQYVFRVDPKVNKIGIAKEIKKIYNVKVLKVNILNTSGRERRVGKTIGFKPGFKKAIITLSKGQSIEFK